MPTTDGSPNNDTLYGDQFADLADTIKGLAGDDTLYGGSAADILYGGDGQDRLEGGSGEDILYGGDTDNAADILVGGDSKDRMYGGGGDDQILINAASEASPSEQWYGGAGYDTIVLSSSITSLSLKALTIGSDIEAIEGGRGISMKASQLDNLTYVHTLDGIVTLTDSGSVNLNGMTGLPSTIYLSALGNSIFQNDVGGGTTIYGGDGDDSIVTPGRLYGGGGDDTLHSVYASEVAFYGGDGDDVISGPSYNAYYGGHGSDTLYGIGGGNDFFPDEPGDADIEKIYGSGAGFGDNLYILAGGSIDVTNWTITGVDNLRSGSIITMTTAQFNSFSYFEVPSIILTTAGSLNVDYAKGYIFDITLSNYGNAVTATGNSMLETVHGGARNDTVTGGDGPNEFYGGAGNDALYGGGSDDLINGGAGSDILSGGAGQYDTLVYEDATGDLTINLSLTTAQNTRGSGSDTISGFEILMSGQFNDTITGASIDDQISGEGGNDTIDGGAGNDSIGGGSGDDTLTGGAGDDGLFGDTGVDTASYASATSAITVSLALTTPQNTGGAGLDSLFQIENLVGSAFADILTGDGGKNGLYGGAGDDLINGGAGNDYMDAGTGNDTVTYADATAGIVLSMVSLSGQNTGGSGTDIIKNFENVIGSGFNDVLTGNQFANALYGGSSDDVLDGGLGNDALYGGTGIDTASYAKATSAITANLSISTAQSTGGAGGDTLSGIENLTGSAYDDRLTGDGSNNVLTGNAGNDQLNGGLGNDTLNGGGGIDAASYATAASAITLSLALTSAQDTHGAGTDTLISIENVTGSAYDDILTGSAQANTILGGNGNDTIDAGSSNDSVDGGYGNDILKGAAGDDVLIGNIGTDTLTGGSGADTLTGGAQSDAFLFTAIGDSAPAAADRITDFASGDKLDVSAIDANTSIGGDQAFHLAAGFTHTAGEYTLAFDAGSNTTTALFDTNGDAAADMAILFTGNVTALTAGFVL